MPSSPWTRIAVVAGKQHGVISIEQLYACGLSRSAVVRAVRAGHLLRLHRGVYAVGHRGTGLKGRWMGATIAAGAESSISHRASTEAHELLRPAGTWTIDVTVPAGGNRQRPGLRIHRAMGVRRGEVLAVEGIRASSPARAVIEIAGTETRHVVAKAVRAGEGKRTLDADEVARILAWHPYAKGRALVVELLRLRDPTEGKTRSDLEIIFFGLCERYGLPLPEVNAMLAANGNRHEVDFTWPELRLAVETDGRQWHEGRYATSLDEVRDRDLTIAGWRVQRLTWRQIILDPAGAAAVLGALIAQQREALAS